MLPFFQETQAPNIPSIAITTPKMGGNVGKNAFFHPLLGVVMIGNKNEMLTKLLNLNPSVFLGF